MEKVLAMPATCTVRLDEALISADDFVAVLTREDGTPVLCYSTDALTLGLALKLITKAFVQCYSECETEEQESVMSILNGPLFEEGIKDGQN